MTFVPEQTFEERSKPCQSKVDALSRRKAGSQFVVLLSLVSWPFVVNLQSAFGGHFTVKGGRGLFRRNFLEVSFCDHVSSTIDFTRLAAMRCLIRSVPQGAHPRNLPYIRSFLRTTNSRATRKLCWLLATATLISPKEEVLVLQPRKPLKRLL